MHDSSAQIHIEVWFRPLGDNLVLTNICDLKRTFHFRLVGNNVTYSGICEGAG